MTVPGPMVKMLDGWRIRLWLIVGFAHAGATHNAREASSCNMTFILITSPTSLECSYPQLSASEQCGTTFCKLGECLNERNWKNWEQGRGGRDVVGQAPKRQLADTIQNGTEQIPNLD